MNTLDMMIFMFFCSITTIMSFVGLSMLLQEATLLQNIGRSTLYLFGTQGIAADLFTWVLWQIGITWIPRFGWQTLFIGAARLLFSYLVIAVPVNALIKLFKKR